jgi:nucleoside-diphosphate-sugar epimerase
LDIITPSKKGIAKTYTWEELEQVPPVDVIIHLAGKAHDTINTADTNTYFEINVGLTSQIFNYFIKSTATKFIFFSSVKAVADSVQGDVLTENTIPDPQTPYGKSKLEAEKIILGRELTNDKKIYILRPCMIHGTGNKGNLNLLYKFVKLGIPYPLGAFENKRSFISIKNLIFILEQIFEKNISSGIYQVADDEALSTSEVITLISNSLGRKEKIFKINKQFIIKLARWGDMFHLPFNSERLKKLTENYVVSNQKITEAMGKQLPYSSREGLMLTLENLA